MDEFNRLFRAVGMEADAEARRLRGADERSGFPRRGAAEAVAGERHGFSQAIAGKIKNFRPDAAGRARCVVEEQLTRLADLAQVEHELPLRIRAEPEEAVLRPGGIADPRERLLDHLLLPALDQLPLVVNVPAVAVVHAAEVQALLVARRCGRVIRGRIGRDGARPSSFSRGR